jgi:hypothetical protein
MDLSVGRPENWGLPSSSVQIYSRVHTASYEIYIVSTFQGVKSQKREADNSIPFCDVIKIAPTVFRAWFVTEQTEGLFDPFYFMFNT